MSWYPIGRKMRKGRPNNWDGWKSLNGDSKTLYKLWWQIPYPKTKGGVQYTYVRQCWPVSWPTSPPDINPVDFYMREPPNTIADISDETIYLKPIVLSYPAQNNSKDWCRENVQAIKVVRLSEHMHMDFLSPCCVVRKAP